MNRLRTSPGLSRLCLAADRESSCEGIADDHFHLVREILAQDPFEEAAVSGRPVRKGCAGLCAEPDSCATTVGASCANVATIASEIPWMAVTAGGIGC